MNENMSKIADEILHNCIKNDNTQIYSCKGRSGMMICGKNIDTNALYEYEKAFAELRNLGFLETDYFLNCHVVTYEGICSIGCKDYCIERVADSMKHILMCSNNGENKVLFFIPIYNEFQYGNEIKDFGRGFTIEEALYKSAVKKAERLNFIEYNLMKKFYVLTQKGIDYVNKLQK